MSTVEIVMRPELHSGPLMVTPTVAVWRVNYTMADPQGNVADPPMSRHWAAPVVNRLMPSTEQAAHFHRQLRQRFLNRFPDHYGDVNISHYSFNPLGIRAFKLVAYLEDKELTPEGLPTVAAVERFLAHVAVEMDEHRGYFLRRLDFTAEDHAAKLAARVYVFPPLPGQASLRGAS